MAKRPHRRDDKSPTLTHNGEGDAHAVAGLRVLDARLHGAPILRHPTGGRTHSVDRQARAALSCGVTPGRQHLGGAPRPMGRWLKLGDLELLVVSDGVLRQDAGAVFGLTPRVMWEPYVPDLDEKHRLPMGLNSMLVRGHRKTVLVETGCGGKRGRTPGAAGGETAGALIGNLARAGIRP